MTHGRRPILARCLSRASDLVRLLAFLAFEYLLPKKKMSWCFCTWNSPYPHTIDNPRGVFEGIKDDPSVHKVVLLKPHHKLPMSSREGRNVSFVNVESLRGAYLVARSKVLILGYSLAGLCTFGRHITKRHKIVQLWHGIPLKRIGRLFPGERFWDTETCKYAATICSAPQDRIFMAEAFFPTPNIWLTGLPRNDLFLQPEDRLPRDYKEQLDHLKSRLAGKKFILYAPTWRDNGSGIYPFSTDQLHSLRTFLSQHHAIIGIRAHANRRPEDPPPCDEMDDVLMPVNEIPDVNIVLRLADVLITDYSSIYIDFLLTGRPILNFTYDLDDYVNERGFLYDLTNAMPETPFRTIDELIIRLDAALDGRKPSSARYTNVTSLFHSHTGSASSAVIKHIKECTSS